MKTIIKNGAHPCLANARDAGWNWEDFHKNNQKGYLAVRQQALNEQADECAYTGLWLGEGTTQTVHLDHFRKKGIYEKLTFDYNNLFAAAKDLPYGSDFKDKMIHGPADCADKQYAVFWSPMQMNLEESFWYRQDGHMLPDEHLTEEEKLVAQNTIDMYNLNNDDLKRKRMGVMRLLTDMQGCDADTIRMCMHKSGFSFLVDFELRNR